MCPQVDSTFSPNSPDETPPGLNTKDLQLGVDGWCATRTFSEIIDPKLRDCIEKSCDIGRIKCKDNCDVGKFVGVNRKIPFITNRTAVVCTNAPTRYLTPEELGSTVIHEWAHGCGWDHGDGGGVPDDPVRPESTSND